MTSSVKYCIFVIFLMLFMLFTPLFVNSFSYWTSGEPDLYWLFKRLFWGSWLFFNSLSSYLNLSISYYFSCSIFCTINLSLLFSASSASFHSLCLEISSCNLAFFPSSSSIFSVALFTVSIICSHSFSCLIFSASTVGRFSFYYWLLFETTWLASSTILLILASIWCVDSMTCWMFSRNDYWVHFWSNLTNSSSYFFLNRVSSLTNVSNWGCCTNKYLICGWGTVTTGSNGLFW